MTGNPSVSSSIEALRAGAWDYLPKPFSATHLQVLIGRASHAVMVARETKALRQQLVQQNGNSDKITLLGVAPAFRKAVELARKVAPTDASVMITGESGTGKEVIAQFIHHHSRRASRKLVPINCAALPEPLLESEMFGHRKGAFTGRGSRQAGAARDRERRHALPRRAHGDVASRFRRSCCACCRTVSCAASAASSRMRRWTCASSRRPIAIRRKR